MGLKLEDVPARVLAGARRLLLDTLGCLVAGSRTELGAVTVRLAGLFGGDPCATMVGQHGRKGVFAAAYANARNANALDFDETFPVGAHFGVGAVAAALVLAEQRDLSGRDALLALITGYELAGRVGSAIGPVVSIEDGEVSGFPAVWGVAAPVVMAAAGAAAKSLGHAASAFRQTIGLAGANAPLPAGAQWSQAVDLPACKYADAGWCTVTGMFGAMAAELGNSGFDRFLDGDSGLVRMYGTDGDQHQTLIAGLGEIWMLDDITFKPWPSCRFTHYPLTALARLLAREPIAPAAIDEIVVETGPLAVSARFTNPEPKTFTSRQFSYPHLVAMMLLGVEPGPRWMDPAWTNDPIVARLKSKVRIVRHAAGGDFAKAFERRQIRTMPGGITVRAGGRTFAARADFADGDPWDPSTRWGDAEVVAKFRGLVAPQAADPVIAAVFALAEADSTAPLMSVLAALATAMAR